MFEFFRGVVTSLDAADHIAIDVGGVGYRLRVSSHTRSTIPLGEEVIIHARLQVKDDDLVLFGFSDISERAAFDLLTSVQGVGPALGMAILSAIPVADLQAVLIKGDAAALKKVKGVGGKTAERLILELKDKTDRIPVPFNPNHPTTPATPVSNLSPAAEETRLALVALGFANSRASSILASIDSENHSAEQLLREALAKLR